MNVSAAVMKEFKASQISSWCRSCRREWRAMHTRCIDLCSCQIFVVTEASCAHSTYSDVELAGQFKCWTPLKLSINCSLIEWKKCVEVIRRTMSWVKKDPSFLISQTFEVDARSQILRKTYRSCLWIKSTSEVYAQGQIFYGRVVFVFGKWLFLKSLLVRKSFIRQCHCLWKRSTSKVSGCSQIFYVVSLKFLALEILLFEVDVH